MLMGAGGTGVSSLYESTAGHNGAGNRGGNLTGFSMHDAGIPCREHSLEQRVAEFPR